MISAWHLVWLLPVAAALGFAVCALLGANREAEHETVLRVFREERDAMLYYIKHLEKRVYEGEEHETDFTNG